MTNRRKKLIEVALPLAAINKESVKAAYVRELFGREPDFGVTSVNYKLAELLAKGGIPC